MQTQSTLFKNIHGSSMPPLHHGREAERNQLAEILRDSAKGSKLVVIQGSAGSGKTALAHGLIPFVEVEEGFFISGKFDPYTIETPYSAPLMALDSLLEQVNKVDENRKSVYRKKIKELLGDRLYLLYGSLPLLKTLMGITGQYDDFRSLELLQEEASQFLEGVELLFSLFAHGKVPFVLLIDEIERADKASLALLKNLLRPDQESRMLIVITCDNDELKRGSMQAELLHDLYKIHSPVEITLKPLEPAEIKDLVFRLGGEPLESFPTEIQDLLLHTTKGNPFYIREILTSLIETQAKEKKFPLPLPLYYQDLYALLEARLLSLSFRTQEILKFCACCGGFFHESLVLQITPYNLDEIEDSFQEMAEKGIIQKIPVPRREKGSEMTWRFSHDLYAKSAEKLLDPKIKILCHLEIAKQLTKGSSGSLLEKNAYALSYQLNLAKPLIRQDEDKVLAYKANTLAAKSALKAGSYSISESYIKSAMDFLPPNKWEDAYKETYQLFLLLGETTYLQGRFEEAEQHLNLLLKQTKSPEERLNVLILLVRQSTSMGEYTRAVKYGDQALSLLGIPVTSWRYRLSFLKEYFLCRIRSLDNPVDTLRSLPQMTDEKAIKQVLVLSIMIPAAYLKERDKLPYYVFKGFNLIMKYGMHPLGPTLLTTWGVVHNRCKRNIDLLCRMGAFALALSETKAYRPNLPAVLFLFGQFIAPFRHSVKESLGFFEKGFREGISQGDLIYAFFCLNQGALLEFILNSNLNELEKRLHTQLDFLEKYKDQSRAQVLIALIQTCRALKGETFHPMTFESKTFSDSQFMKKLRENSYNTTTFIAKTAKMELAYLFGNYDEVIGLSERAKPYAIYLSEHFIYTEHLFFLTLALIKLYPKKDPRAKFQIKRKIAANLLVFRRLEKESSGRFHGKYWLIEAEVEALFGDPLKAVKNFEKALKLSQEAGILQNEALIYENFAHFWLSQDLLQSAVRFLEISKGLYEQWGAKAKVAEIENRIIEWGKAE